MNGAAFDRHGVEVTREFSEVPLVRVDKHKVLQVLINLIRNAKYAVSESSRRDKRITVRIHTGENRRVHVSVIDNGIGIASENLARIFGHGFTTKKDGHGFGLHSAALAATETGGALTVHSDGPNQGATFTLELPIDESIDARIATPPRIKTTPTPPTYA
jgi:C4-dicarboxylate-specific signal transduction histidine kinase